MSAITKKQSLPPAWQAYRDLFAAVQSAKGWLRVQLVDALNADAKAKALPNCTYSIRTTVYWEADPKFRNRSSVPRPYRIEHVHQWLSAQITDVAYADRLAAIAPPLTASDTSNSEKLETLAATTTTKAKPPWEIAVHTFEAAEAEKPEMIIAGSAKTAAQGLPIPPQIRKLLDEAEKLTDGDEYADAIPVLEKALKAARRAKHVAGEVKAHIRLSKVVFEANEDFVSGEEHCRKALALLGTKASINSHSALHGLGDMLLRAGRMDEASAVIRSSLDVARSLGDQDSVARSLISVSLLERSLGNGLEAAARLDEAILILHQLSINLDGKKKASNAYALAVCYANKAQFHIAEGRPVEAIALFAKVLAQHGISNEKLNLGKAQLRLGELHCAIGDTEEGFQSFKRALALFSSLKNSLWMARATTAMARLYAHHAGTDNFPNTELWEEAARAAFHAIRGFEEAGASSERIEGLLLAARILAQLVKAGLRDDVRKQIQDFFKKVPKDLEADAAGKLNAQMDRVHAEIAEKVRKEPAVGELIENAKQLAYDGGNLKLLADSYLAEVDLRIAEGDTDGRKRLTEQALEALNKALLATSVPKRKAHIMARIGSLCRELGRKTEWASWVKRVGELSEQTGHLYGMATYYCEMGHVLRSQGKLDEQIASERKALELIEGRSFYDIAAGARINLAEGLRLRRKFSEALRLLEEAETICVQHRFQEMVSKIARIRSQIEENIEAGQAARHTLPQMLCSLHQLVRYRAQDAASYLAFWYYAWKTELLAVLRSGPGVTLMVVSDEVGRFMAFTGRFTNLADHFALATTTEPTVVATARTLTMPQQWRYPANFTFMGVRKSNDIVDDSTATNVETDAPPNIRLLGPARQMPPYMHVAVGGNGSCISVMDTPHLPPEAVQLMLQRPIKELIQRRAVWFPSPRDAYDDPFLTDLRVGYYCGLFPAYLDRLPTSKDVAVIGSTSIQVGHGFLAEPASENVSKWKRSLLKLTRLSKTDANVALLDLADSFLPAATGEMTITFEVHLFEFPQLDKTVVHPALLFQEQ